LDYAELRAAYVSWVQHKGQWKSSLPISWVSKCVNRYLAEFLGLGNADTGDLFLQHKHR